MANDIIVNGTALVIGPDDKVIITVPGGDRKLMEAIVQRVTEIIGHDKVLVLGGVVTVTKFEGDGVPVTTTPNTEETTT